MKSVFRNFFIMTLCVSVALFISGGAKRLMAAEKVAPAVESAAPPASSNKAATKSVVAKVNGVKIYSDELENMTDILSANIAPPRAEPRNETRNKALDQMIFHELALQYAENRKIRVMEREINRAISAMKYHDQSNLDDYLASHHLTLEQLRAQIRRNILLNRIFEREVSEKISIPDEEIRKEYKDHKDRYVKPEGQMSYEEAKDVIEGRLRAEAQQKRSREWEQELKKDAKIEIIENVGSQKSEVRSQK